MSYFSLSTSRRHPWSSLSDVATSVSLGRLRSASAPEPFVSSMAEPSIPSHRVRSPKKSALKRPTSAVYSSESSSSDSTPDSSLSSSPVPSPRPSPVQVDLWSTCSPLASHDADKNESVFTPSPRAKSSLMTRIRNIQIFAPSPPPHPRRCRASREFATLPPPPEWDEVSLTFDSDSDDDHLAAGAKVKDDQLSAPMTRRVRFVVAAPPPPPPTPEIRSRCWDEEPTCSEFMAIASVSLLIMETVQRVKTNKDGESYLCMAMTERAYELVCAIINICRDSEAELAPAMIRSVTQFSETLEKILSFVRSQVKGGLLRRVFRSMEDADLITECNAGLKHALDVFGVQSGIIAAMTMAEMQKDAKQRHEELIAILKEKRSRPKRSSTSGSDGSSPVRKRPSSLKTDARSGISMLPASPKVFHGREEEISHIISLITRSEPARIAICGAEGMGKTAVAVAASNSPELAEIFKDHRYFVDCEDATDNKQLVATIANQLALEGTGKKHVFRHLEATATEETPVLLVLDALDRAWKPRENRSDVEDFPRGPKDKKKRYHLQIYFFTTFGLPLPPT
ncbi:hypothetical protein B0H16DRAFT_1810487 [Mycena metata]|uniref:ORC1/DEAH AAA+ ATPase domain-containing protein n=1 Tax=Mycena metata TaxID=1033252 RepID=A0AAD7H681_9AGAR|nr:hypothetical protein B0H16DRAFT_1810487 [Mycena metata]